MAIKNTNFGGTDWTDNEVQESVDYNDTFNATDDWIDDNVGAVGSNGNLSFPIGSMVAWHKSLSGVPSLTAGWVECNGQTLSDGDSPFDGQTIPDLNDNNRFLRGSTTSGTTGGSDSHRHQYLGSGNGDTYGSSGPDYPVNGSYSDYQDNIPPFINMVWIIREK